MLSQLCVRATYKNTCEDAVFVKETASSVFGCVTDGCSSGINSAWASQLLCYLVQNRPYEITEDQYLAYLRIKIRDIISDFHVSGMSEMNLLSTCLLFDYNKKTEILKLRIIGDGVYYLNGVEYVIDHNNIPDYLAYHLYDDFESFIKKYPEFIHENVHSFQICTDGIKSFQLSQFESSDKNPSILLESPTSENYLKRMFNILTKNKWTIADDLSIISYVNQPEATD